MQRLQTKFHDKRTLAQTRFESLGATEGSREDEREGRELQRAARKIVQDATATVTRECAVALPKYKSLARSIERQHGWEITQRRGRMAIPSELQLTLREENFVAYDSDSNDMERFKFKTQSKIWISSKVLSNGTRTEH